MRTLRLLPLVILAALVLLTGCAKKEATPEGTDTTQTGTAPTPPDGTDATSTATDSDEDIPEVPEEGDEQLGK
jgi:uncharacterized lipoprotein YajG